MVGPGFKPTWSVSRSYSLAAPWALDKRCTLQVGMQAEENMSSALDCEVEVPVQEDMCRDYWECFRVSTFAKLFLHRSLVTPQESSTV